MSTSVQPISRINASEDDNFANRRINSGWICRSPLLHPNFQVLRKTHELWTEFAVKTYSNSCVTYLGLKLTSFLGAD